MKKILLVLVALIFSGTAISFACGGNGNVSSENQASSSQTSVLVNPGYAFANIQVVNDGLCPPKKLDKKKNLEKKNLKKTSDNEKVSVQS